MLKKITIRNQKILKYLEEFISKDCIEGKLSYAKGWDGTNYEEIKTYSTCNETLLETLKDRSYLHKFSFNKIFGETEGGIFFRETIGEALYMQRYYTSAYVPKGFVGWHADDDIAGYYLLFTYSRSGKGFFKYRDPLTEEIHTLYDEAGWMLRGGKMGVENDEIVWHCASAEDDRYTFLLVYDDEDIFNNCLKIIDEEVK